MLCHTLLPGLGQMYNGRRLKVGVMVGFASYYYRQRVAQLEEVRGRDRERATPPPRAATEFRHAEPARGLLQGRSPHVSVVVGSQVWLLGILDSWIDAHLYDVRGYTPPSPPEEAVPHAGNERMNYLTLGFNLEFSK